MFTYNINVHMHIYKTFQPKIISTKPRINKLLVAKILYFHTVRGQTHIQNSNHNQGGFHWVKIYSRIEIIFQIQKISY